MFCPVQKKMQIENKKIRVLFFTYSLSFDFELELIKYFKNHSIPVIVLDIIISL